MTAGLGLYEGIERVARHVAAGRATAGVGKVVSTHPAGPGSPAPNHAVTVEMRESGLVLPEVPVAVGAMGFAVLPAIDDLVLVVFAEGDFNAPIVAGRLYNADQRPPEHKDDQLVFRLPPGQAKGDLNLVVDMGKPSITLDLPGGLKLTLQEGQAVLEVGKMRLTLSGSGSGEATLEAGRSSIRLKQDQSIALTAQEITLKADTRIAMEAAQIQIKGSGVVEVAGGMLKLN